VINKLLQLTLLLLGFVLTAQAQQATTAAGGNATGSGGSVAYSVGQIVYTTHTGTTGSVAQGVQQTYENLKVTPKTMLAGCFDPATGLMYDSLRVLNLIPLQEPYSSAPYNATYIHVNGSGGETTSASVFAVTGPNAIVDWVFVQLRNKLDSNIVLATRSALIQRDGDIVDIDGVSPVIFANNNADNYFISIKHRNHLGIMTKAPIPISYINTNVNLTTTAIPLFTKPGKAGNPAPLSGATKMISGVRCMYAGNCNISLLQAANTYIYFNNTTNSDRSTLYNITGGVATILGYTIYDVDLNGFARFNGLYPDRLVIFSNTGSSNLLYTNEQMPN
jgi:hypothetical protein